MKKFNAKINAKQWRWRLFFLDLNQATPLLRPRSAIDKDDGLKIENRELFSGPTHPHRFVIPAIEWHQWDWDWGQPIKF